ncbi:uncharacterized protein TNCV_2200341 [Trichonephila clavipes]|nr:uncharacterized protein TNCV_2200341 [Trichonephila clavipes]
MGKYYRPSRRRIFLSRNRSSCAVKQFHSDVSGEAVDDRRCGQRVMIDICSAWFLNHRTASFRQSAAPQHMQLLPCPAYSSDMSPIEHVWDLFGRRLIRDPRPAASKDELLLHI